jgi:hypothetical protein
VLYFSALASLAVSVCTGYGQTHRFVIHLV